MNLAVNFAGIHFKNPIVAASGCFGFGREYNEFFDISRLGGICIKGLTLKPRLGNKPPRIAETPMGMLNSVGLQNPGVDSFINEQLPFLRKHDTVIIANISGETVEQYAQITGKLSDSDVDIIEVNVSCPNVKAGGISFGTSAQNITAVTRAVIKETNIPVMVKLSPNVTNIADMAKAAQDAGAHAISLINTLLGMRINTVTRRPILHNNVGGLSGPAVLPIAVRMVWQVRKAVDIPILGMGGVTTGNDAVEMMLAGADLVGVGTACISDPLAPVRIITQLEEYMTINNIRNLTDISGMVVLN